MKGKTKKNSGFTLVELIIAMAILAFLMTAVSAFMLSGVMSSKKAKADIVVHNTAQDVYDQLADSIMSAKDIIIYAYVIDGELSDANPGKSLVFGMGENDVNESVTGPIYFVRDKEQKAALPSIPGYNTGSEVRYYKDLNSGVKLYVKQLIIDKAVPYDFVYVSTAAVDGKYTNNLTGELVAITPQKTEVEYDADGNLVAESNQWAVSYSGNFHNSFTYSENDTERNIYTFDSKYMYYERKYAFMDKLDDYASGTDKSDYVYSKSFNYLNLADGTDTVTGCVLTVDADGGALGLDLFFSDKNMTYTTLGMINTRNSYVLKAKK